MPTIKEALLGTDEQNRVAQANLDKQASEGSKLAKFLGGNPEPKPVQETPKPVAKKKGGMIHNMEHAKKHAAGFQHEQDKAKKHSAGHKMNHEHVKAMCMGGKAK